MALVVVLGGARSGKSAFAQRLAAATDAAVTVIATAEARDDEMAERIARHRAARPTAWTTVEEPLDVAGALAAAPAHACVVLDCLTLWVSNALGAGWPAERIEREADRAAALARDRIAPTLVVSNEVGMGLVPMTELGRSFRDVQGRVNAAFCAVADRAVLIVAGRMLDLISVDELVEVFARG
ncbi:MAG: bifunctional adenosylcobinamide kinase/adenosylcobinamide-phosphate guanylyltransferase [Actinomycetota bacterium]